LGNEGHYPLPFVPVFERSGRATAGALCLLQDGGGGIGKHLAPQDNIRGVRILREVVADAPDARDK
jgi:hypothetical protein